jgi:hypothetical protein
VAAGFVVKSAAREAKAQRTAAESALVEAELGSRIARAELTRAIGGELR